jgi:prevent-host-death family protein
MEMFNVLDARNNLSKLVARAQAGEEIVISRRGQPAARLVPMEPERGEMTGREFAAWLEQNAILRGSRTTEEIDEAVREERATWG